MAKQTQTAELEFNSPEGIAIATKAVAAAKTFEDCVALFETRPGNVGHKVIINLMRGRPAIKAKKS